MAQRASTLTDQCMKPLRKRTLRPEVQTAAYGGRRLLNPLSHFVEYFAGEFLVVHGSRQDYCTDHGRIEMDCIAAC